MIMIGKRAIKIRLRKFFPAILGVCILFVGIGAFSFWPKADFFIQAPKTVLLSDNNVEFSFREVAEKTVGEFLDSRNLSLKKGERVFPPSETALTPGMKIFIERTHEIIVLVDGTKTSFFVRGTSVGEALIETGIVIDEDDIILPEREAPAFRKSSITITRVNISEQTIEKSVAFEKKTNEDAELSWRKTVVTQKGEKGIDRLVYRVSTHDGKEVSRKLIRTDRVKEPVTEIVTQGTAVKLGKSHTGGASWYAWTGTMAAANPWLPKGSYVKVTNLENGKSVIVVINDRGPFVPGRIIDLDKVAFAKIASVGAGVITVKMEEITN